MKWSYRMCAFVAAALASTQWFGSTNIHAEVMNLVDSVTAPEPGWKYLYTLGADGRSVNSTHDPNYVFAIPGAGGVAIWALPETELSAVAGTLYSAADPNALSEGEIEVLTWQDGSAPFHWGGMDAIPAGSGTPLVQPLSGHRRTQYFVKDFVAPGEVTQVNLEAAIDDIAVIYLDGVEIFRGGNAPNSPALVSLPGEVPAYEDGGTTDVGAESLRNFGVLADLVISPGPHRLGVEVHQGGGSFGTGSSDMGMSIRLSGDVNIVPEPASALALLFGTLGLGLMRRRSL